MVTWVRGKDKQGNLTYFEQAPEVCPYGHHVIQRLGWTGCDAGGHRNWRCSRCYALTIDPDCECQGGGDPECE